MDTPKRSLDKEDELKYTRPVNENEYIPARGAVNFPDVKFMALPMFSTSSSKTIGVFVILRSIGLLRTKK